MSSRVGAINGPKKATTLVARQGLTNAATHPQTTTNQIYRDARAPTSRTPPLSTATTRPRIAALAQPKQPNRERQIVAQLAQAAASITRAAHLRRLDLVIVDPVRSPVAFAVVSRKVARPYMEDYWASEVQAEQDAQRQQQQQQQQQQQLTHVFAVFDGHGGKRCSMYLSENLLPAVRTHAMFETDLEQAVTASFAQIDNDFLANAKTRRVGDGSTACVVFFRGQSIVCANVGDSRAVLLRSKLDDGNLVECIPLSSDHKPNRPDETSRIVRAGAKVILVRGVHRVNGNLAVSRAFGDIHSKPHGVSSTPEIRTEQCTERDKLVVIASDGLWDVVTNDELPQLFLNFLSGAESIDLYGFAFHLAQTARQRGSGDNTTVVVIKAPTVTTTPQTTVEIIRYP